MEVDLVKNEGQAETMSRSICYSQNVRDVLLHGCRLSNELEQALKSSDQRLLAEASGGELRWRFLGASHEIVKSFCNAIKMLLPDASGSQQQHPGAKELVEEATCTPTSGDPKSSEKNGKLSSNSESLVSTTRSGETRPLSPLRVSSNGNRASRPTSSPPSNGSPASEASEGSPSRLPPLNVDARNGKRREPHTSSKGYKSDRGSRENHKRRKAWQKITVKMPASSPQQGSEIPPDDGHTWRKYGQKEILGAVYPRSYYRCTHKNDLGCLAIKYVQRCDDSPSIFDVTYRGKHSCRSEQSDSQLWPFAFPLSLPPLTIQCLPSSVCTANSGFSPTIMFNGNGGLQLSPAFSSLYASHQLPHASPSVAQASGNVSLPLRPGNLPSPSQIVTPRFGMGLPQTNPEFLTVGVGPGGTNFGTSSEPGNASFLSLFQARSPMHSSKELNCSKQDGGAIVQSPNFGGEICEMARHENDCPSVREPHEPYYSFCREHPLHGMDGPSLHFSSEDWLSKELQQASREDSSPNMQQPFLSPATSEVESSHQAAAGRPFPGSLIRRDQTSESEVTEVVSEHVPAQSPFYGSFDYNMESPYNYIDLLGLET